MPSCLIELLFPIWVSIYSSLLVSLCLDVLVRIWVRLLWKYVELFPSHKYKGRWATVEWLNGVEVQGFYLLNSDSTSTFQIIRWKREQMDWQDLPLQGNYLQVLDITSILIHWPIFHLLTFLYFCLVSPAIHSSPSPTPPPRPTG